MKCKICKKETVSTSEHCPECNQRIYNIEHFDDTPRIFGYTYDEIARKQGIKHLK